MDSSAELMDYSNISDLYLFINNTITGLLSAEKIAYAIFDGFMAVATILGNLIIIVAFTKEPNLRSVTNFFIFSLAVTDLLVGVVGMPVYIYSMLTDLPNHFELCLVINTWILMLCTVSIFHLIALSLDRYTVIVMMTRMTQAKKEKRAYILIGAAWMLGGVVGSLPLMGWNMGPSAQPRCVFIEIMDFSYLVFLFYFTIITPTAFMIFFYVSIYRTVRRHAKNGIHNKKMNKQKLKHFARQRKIIMCLVIVIAAFLVCWYPLYTLNAIVYYYPKIDIEPMWFYVAIVLSHLSSAINPLIYAYTMPGFKQAFRRVVTCQKPLPRRASMAMVGSSALLTNMNVNTSNLNIAKDETNITKRRSSSTSNLKWFITDDNSDGGDRRGSYCSIVNGVS